ncbi:hypothetical protein DPMN_005116 [Dreissena polymorpha]|uniref:Uncharacterized protein n=1 Tax=Dreissena polymorpha TaxID=45954 RepID=A0A9D4MPP1_DREPO|nr:hypothetical protein DPMN_005116 [Dreissena polymorpha]
MDLFCSEATDFQRVTTVLTTCAVACSTHPGQCCYSSPYGERSTVVRCMDHGLRRRLSKQRNGDQNGHNPMLRPKERREEDEKDNFSNRLLPSIQEIDDE